MAYSRAWTDTTPVSTDPASGAPTDMQHIRIDLRERLMTMFAMPDFTSDPLKISSLSLGYAVSTFGGHVDYTNDAGVTKWRVGLDNGAGSTSFVIRDLIAGSNRIAIDATSGDVSLSNKLHIGTNPGLNGAIGIPNNTAITSRNAANTADVNLIYLSGTNVITFDTTIQIGSGGNININNGSLSVTGGNITGSGSGLTNIPGANVTGTVANATNATTSASCSGNAATATTATNSTQLGGVGSASYALKSGTSALVVTGASVTAAAFYIV